jgi:hypothetical protein
MNSRQQNTLSTFKRIQDWLAQRPEITGITVSAGTAGGSSTTPTSIGAQSLLLDAALNDAVAAGANQDGLSRSILGLGAETKTLRTQLISDEMVHVATIARQAIPDVVRMTEAFRVPRVTRKTEALLAAAESMAKAGEQYKDKLVAGGLSADFPAELRSAAAALNDVVTSRGSDVANRKGASTSFHEALVRGRKAVDTLTVLIKRQLKGDKATIASWTLLRRIPIVGVRTPSGTVVPAPVPVTVPAASAPVQGIAPATAPVTAVATASELQSKVA